jgi:hypothetical protein
VFPRRSYMFKESNDFCMYDSFAQLVCKKRSTSHSDTRTRKTRKPIRSNNGSAEPCPNETNARGRSLIARAGNQQCRSSLCMYIKLISLDKSVKWRHIVLLHSYHHLPINHVLSQGPHFWLRHRRQRLCLLPPSSLSKCQYNHSRASTIYSSDGC